MSYRTFIQIFLCTVLLAACRDFAPESPTTRIDWDTWGVPHVFANSETEFFFADGWAQMEAHANLLLQLYGVSRGRAAEYWGVDYLESDRLVHTLGHPAQAERMWAEQSPDLKRMLAAFSDGINAWARQNPGAIEPTNHAVLPVSAVDTNLHSLFVVNTRFIAGRELGLAQRWEDRGSNAIAVAPQRSAGAHAMLVQNPHLPWSGEFLFFEKHAILGGHNIYGVNLVGMPGFAIAFNDHLGWTHTNNPIDNADLYELELDGDGYRFGGERLAFEQHMVTLKLREDDGSLSDHPLTVRRSVHGPVIRAGEQQALALRVAGQDHHDSLLQWWRMATATRFDAFESALKMAQIPFWNIVYADREGTIYYQFNGHVPRRSHGDWDYWQAPVDGGDPATLWHDIHPFSDLPRVRNPATGWLHNANDPPWTSTLPQVLDARNYPPYFSHGGMEFRPQRAARMILQDDSISFDELVAIKHDTRMEVADRLLDDLAAAVAVHGSDLAREAAQVLSEWDRRADSNSRGAVLFQHWARAAIRADGPLFARPWSPDDPLNTPDGLADPTAMAALLDTVARQTLEQYGRLDIRWGEVNRIEHGAIDLPASGANSELGVFRVAAARPSKESTQRVLGGDSWVGVIEFSDPPRARVLLSYGNSSQPDSPHNGDQLRLFSEQRLREAWRTPAQLRGNIVRSMLLAGDRFEVLPRDQAE
jgi:acyl-homoserine-lactone acylase